LPAKSGHVGSNPTLSARITPSFAVAIIKKIARVLRVKNATRETCEGLNRFGAEGVSVLFRGYIDETYND